jgi:hypothetical protein
LPNRTYTEALYEKLWFAMQAKDMSGKDTLSVWVEGVPVNCAISITQVEAQFWSILEQSIKIYEDK